MNERHVNLAQCDRFDFHVDKVQGCKLWSLQGFSQDGFDSLALKP